ncbi:MAG: hypothetical protein Q9N67_06560 [Ghiorsea sp.]|nr:hypothetical protein [Ghiorsea sp.]
MKQLVDMLLSRQSVNLHAPHGRGRRYILQRLQLQLVDVRVRKIDLKREQKQWDVWCEDVSCLSGQVIVIIHNIEFLTAKQKSDLPRLRRFVLLCVSVLPMLDEGMALIEIPIGLVEKGES